MKFQFQTVTSLEDAARNFEQITAHGIDDATALSGDLTGTMPAPTFSAQGLGKMLRPTNNLSDVASRATALTNLGIARGTGSVTFTASNISDAPVIAHGLGATPTAVLITMTSLFGVEFASYGYTNTNFTAQATTGSAASVSVPFCWMAVL